MHETMCNPAVLNSTASTRNSFQWSLVCITTRNEEQCAAYREEVDWLWRCGALNAERFLVVEDPCEDLGSGGSSLNALLIAVEHLCVLRGLTVLSEDVLADSRILIVNCGRDYSLNRCGSAFLDLGNDLITETGYRVPQNIFVHQLDELNQLACFFGNGVWIIGGDAFWKLGILDIPDDVTEKTDSVLAFTFNADSEFSKTSGVYRINDERKIIGIDYCSDKYENVDQVSLVMTLLYMPVRVASAFLSLYSVHPLSSCTYYGIDNGSPGLQLSIFFDFVLAAADGMEKNDFVYGYDSKRGTVRNGRVEKAREVLYNTFSRFSAFAVLLDVEKYHYFQPASQDNVLNFWGIWNEEKPRTIAEVNAHLFLPGLKDPLHSKEPLDKCFRANRAELFERWFSAIGSVIKQNKNRSIESFLKSVCVAPGDGSSPAFRLIRYLHKICLEENAKDFSDRALFCIAEILALLARQRGGLRSGPAGNVAFARCIRMLQDGAVEQGLNGMRSELVHWMDTPERLIRAARHFEAAGQVFIQRNVMDFCIKHLPWVPEGRGMNSGVSVACACRVDVSGGWTDTPPITMQVHRSAVVNIAVMVDGKRPIGCEIFPSYSRSGICIRDLDLKIFTVDEIRDLSSKPSLPGSLVCAVLLASRFVREEDSNLASCFARIFSNGITGLEVSTFSSLPHGSGLGTSSILAATLLTALWTLMGVKFDVDNVCHAVLLAEQYLTTGGGWQDQVGGIVPGIKISRFSRVERKVLIEPLSCQDSFISTLNERLVLIYTGQTRLAKNLLQQVIRSWYAKDPHLTSVLKSLANAAENSAKKFSEGIFPVEETEQYYRDKKAITPTCEPTFVNRLVADLRDNGFIESAWLAGAGGGGFLNVWLLQGVSIDCVKTHLSLNEAYQGLSVHSVTVDMDPLKVVVHERYL